MSDTDYWSDLRRIWQTRNEAETADLAVAVRRQSRLLSIYVAGLAAATLAGVVLGSLAAVNGVDSLQRTLGVLVALVCAGAGSWELWMRRATLRERTATSREMLRLRLERSRVNVRVMTAARLAFGVALLFFLAALAAAVVSGVDVSNGEDALSAAVCVVVYAVGLAVVGRIRARETERAATVQALISDLEREEERS